MEYIKYFDYSSYFAYLSPRLNDCIILVHILFIAMNQASIYL